MEYQICCSPVQDPGVTVAVKLIHLQGSKSMDGAIPLLLIMTSAMISAKVIFLLDVISGPQNPGRVKVFTNIMSGGIIVSVSVSETVR